MCQWVLSSCPTSCLSWRESSYRVRVNRERDLLPQGSSELVLVAAENLLHLSHRVVCGCWTREVFLHDRVYLVRGVEVVFQFYLRRHALALIFSPSQNKITCDSLDIILALNGIFCRETLRTLSDHPEGATQQFPVAKKSGARHFLVRFPGLPRPASGKIFDLSLKIFT